YVRRHGGATLDVEPGRDRASRRRRPAVRSREARPSHPASRRRRAGVSAMTVSRVINESPRVSADTRRRVQASIAKLGYVPNRLARSLIQRKTRSFGVSVPAVANPFFTLIVRGIERVAWRAGYHVILCDTQGDLDRERGYLEDMVSFQVEGVLLAPVGDSSKPHLRLLTRNGVPFVLIDRSIAG